MIWCTLGFHGNGSMINVLFFLLSLKYFFDLILALTLSWRLKCDICVTHIAFTAAELYEWVFNLFATPNWIFRRELGFFRHTSLGFRYFQVKSVNIVYFDIIKSCSYLVMWWRVCTTMQNVREFKRCLWTKNNNRMKFFFMNFPIRESLKKNKNLDDFFALVSSRCLLLIVNAEKHINMFLYKMEEK